MRRYGVACALQSVLAGILGSVILSGLWRKGFEASVAQGLLPLFLVFVASLATAFLAFKSCARERARLPFAIAEFAWTLVYALVVFGAWHSLAHSTMPPLDPISHDPLAVTSVVVGFAARDAVSEIVMRASLVPLAVHLVALGLGIWGATTTRTR